MNILCKHSDLNATRRPEELNRSLPRLLQFFSLNPDYQYFVLQGNNGYLKYQDTSTGKMIAEISTRLGRCDCMTQNPYNAIINLGHANGESSYGQFSVLRSSIHSIGLESSEHIFDMIIIFIYTVFINSR